MLSQEIAIEAAVDIPIQGCVFHWTQAVRRKVLILILICTGIKPPIGVSLPGSGWHARLISSVCLSLVLVLALIRPTCTHKANYSSPLETWGKTIVYRSLCWCEFVYMNLWFLLWFDFGYSEVCVQWEP